MIKSILFIGFAGIVSLTFIKKLLDFSEFIFKKGVIFMIDIFRVLPASVCFVILVFTFYKIFSNE